MPKVKTLSDQSLRMRRLREASGKNGPAFAAFLGISYQRWNNFENNNPVSRQIADLLVSKIGGLTTDYIHNGGTGGLSVDLARRLGELESKGTTAPRKAPGGR